MNSTSKTPQVFNSRPQNETVSPKSSTFLPPPEPHTTAVDTGSPAQSTPSPSPSTWSKPELDLLVEALQRLDQDYQFRNQQFDQQLNALAGQLEHLDKHVGTLTAQVSYLAGQLSHFRDG